jgi:hypothetical protein
MDIMDVARYHPSTLSYFDGLATVQHTFSSPISDSPITSAEPPLINAYIDEATIKPQGDDDWLSPGSSNVANTQTLCHQRCFRQGHTWATSADLHTFELRKYLLSVAFHLS